MSADLDKLFKKKKIYPEDVFIDIETGNYKAKTTNCHDSCHGGHGTHGSHIDHGNGKIDKPDYPKAVPLPSVIWIFLSGIFFLFFINRRK